VKSGFVCHPEGRDFIGIYNNCSDLYTESLVGRPNRFHWVNYPQWFNKEPKDQQKHEIVVFSPLTVIFNQVVKAIIATSKLTTASNLGEFLDNPNKAPTSSAITIPDVYLVLKQRPEAPRRACILG
jgi:hypothetical protein